MDSQRLEQTILTLLSGKFGSADEGAATNMMLCQYVDESEAWQTSLSLFESHHDHVRFFAANIINTKVKRHWHQLNSQQRLELFGAMSTFLRSIAAADLPLTGSTKAFIERVILSLASISARIPGCINTLVQIALEFCGSFDKQQDLLAFHILVVIPGEVEDLDISRSLRLELEEQLHLIAPTIGSLLDKFVTSGVAYKASLINVIKILKGWAKYGIGPSYLLVNHPTFGVFFSNAMQTGDGEIISECTLLVAELFGTREDESASQNDVRNALLHLLVSHGARLAPFLSQPGDDNQVASDICNALVAVGNVDIDFIASPHNVVAVEYFTLLLACCNHRPRKTAAQTFDIWISIVDIPVSERHPYLVTELFRGVLNIMFSQSVVTAPPGTEDYEDVMEFRDWKLGIQEVVSICFESLQGEFLALLQQKIRENASDMGVVEVIVFFLSACAESLKANRANPGMLQFIHFITQNILLIPAAAIDAQPVLKTSLATFFGRITFLLTGEPSFCVFFATVVRFLVSTCCMEDEDAAPAAARSLRQLCTHGNRLVNEAFEAASTPLSFEMIDLVCVRILGGPQREVRGRAAVDGDDAGTPSFIASLSALASVVTAVSMACEATVLATHMGKLAHVLCENMVTGEKVEYLLCCAGTIVASCKFNGDGTHPVLPFLGGLWEKILQIEAHGEMMSTKWIVARLIGFYEQCMSSVPMAMDAHLPKLAGLIQANIDILSETSVAPLRCAKVIVEMIGRVTQLDVSAFVLELFNAIAHTVGAQLNQTSSLPRPFDLDTMENFFDFVDACLVHWLVVVVRSGMLEPTIRACMYCLPRLKERDVLRPLLRIMGHIFFVDVTSEEKRAAVGILLPVRQQAGPDLVKSVFELLFLGGRDTAATTLVQQLVDVVFAVIAGSSVVGCTAQCKEWFGRSCADPAMWDRVPATTKPALFELMFHLAQENQRMFRMLLQDLVKIHNGTQTLDCLATYEGLI